MAEFREHSPEFDQALKESVIFSHMLLDDLLRRKKESKVFRRGMYCSLMTCLCNMISFYHPTISKEETMAMSQCVTEHLRQNPKIRDLIGEQA